MHQLYINSITTALQKELPGAQAQFQMAHTKREHLSTCSPDLTHYRESAVLVLLYPNEANKLVILLIERSTYNGHHSGQIALPGGKKELTDVDLQATALREFFEETGCELTPEIIGALSPITIPVSKFIVQPFVAHLKKKPQFSINTHEVNALIEWPIDSLLNPDAIKTKTIEPITGVKLKTPYFDVDGKVLWGATAMMLNELKHVIVDAKQ